MAKFEIRVCIQAGIQHQEDAARQVLEETVGIVPFTASLLVAIQSRLDSSVPSSDSSGALPSRGKRLTCLPTRSTTCPCVKDIKHRLQKLILYSIPEYFLPSRIC